MNKRITGILLLAVVLGGVVICLSRIVSRGRAADNIQVATIKGDLQRVTELLKAKPSLANEETYRRFTPLHWAALYGHAQIAKALLKAGAYADCESEGQDTPLQLAAENGQVGVATLLIAAGAQVNRPNCYQQTPLMLAAMRGQLETMNLLIHHGAEIEAPSGDGTALCYAAFSHEWRALDLLLAHGAKPNVNGSFGPPLQSAATFSPPATKSLLDHGADPNLAHNHEALQSSAMWGQTEAVTLLLKHGAKPNGAGESGDTPLQNVANNYDWPRNADILGTANVLLRYGAGVNATGGTETPLAIVICNGRVALIRLLLAHGAKADPFFIAVGEDDAAKVAAFIRRRPQLANARDSDGCTPLMIAACGGHARTATVLLASGAKVDALDSDGETALVHAALGGKDAVVKLLLAHGARLTIDRRENKDGSMARWPLEAAAEGGQVGAARLLMAAEKDAQERKRKANLVLWTACMAGSTKMVDFLISQGADVNFRSLDGGTVLTAFCGVTNGNALELVKTLVKHGANVNARNKFDDSALHQAAVNPKPGVAGYLLRRGANPNAIDAGGNSPMDTTQDPETIALLLRCGGVKWKANGLGG
jgi:ankyrin repeat protein